MAKKIVCAMLLAPWLGYALAFNNQLAGSETPSTVKPQESGQCIIYATMTVLTKPQEDAAGDQILVKPGQDNSCSWDKNGWLVDSGDASYFIGKWHDFVFIDRGTGPDGRDVIIFNSKSKHLSFNDTYASPLLIQENKLSYWQPSTILASPANCPTLAEARQSGFTPEIQRQTSVNLSQANLQARVAAKTRCTMLQ